MSWDEISNRALTIQKDTFGCPVEYKDSMGNLLSISAVFLAKYIEVEPGTRSKVESSSVAFHVFLADIAVGPKKNDVITYNSVTYLVHGVEPDGEGSAILKVRKCTSEV